MGKHLVLLIDGTWQTASSVPSDSTYTNIFQLNLLLSHRSRKREPQIVFYSRGLGAVEGEQRILAGAFARGLPQEVEDAYMHLSANYEDGDKIYIYGFSRGAVIARVVASLVARIGLLQAEHNHLFPDIWAEYKKYEMPPSPSPDLLKYCHAKVQVEFLGVFDTVYGGNETEEEFREHLHFAGRSLSQNVKHGVHILAIDEQRPLFKPLLWESGINSEHPSIEQIWMPGVHGDIGGCYPARFLGDVSLLTMVKKTQSRTGLHFLVDELDDLEARVQKENWANIKINNEWTGIFGWAKKYLRAYERKPPVYGANQYIHPVIDRLCSSSVVIREEKERVRYNLPERFKHLKLADF